MVYEHVVMCVSTCGCRKYSDTFCILFFEIDKIAIFPNDSENVFRNVFKLKSLIHLNVQTLNTVLCRSPFGNS